MQFLRRIGVCVSVVLACAEVQLTWGQCNPEELAKLLASDAAELDGFGLAVALSGDTAVVGAFWDDHAGGTNAGSAYVFVRSGGVWTQQAKLTASDAAASDYFGQSVALFGDTAVIGAPGDNHSAGSAYVFVRSGGIWSQQAKLTAFDPAWSDSFGESVAVSGDTAVIGALLDYPAGSAYVFVRSGGVWTLQAKLTASDSAAVGMFGCSVAFSGDTAVIGAYHTDLTGRTEAGAAYVFIRSDGVWTQQANLTASDAAADDWFGFSVAFSGDTAVIGAPYSIFVAGYHPGSAYVFVRSGGVWTQQAKLTASDAAAYDEFGDSVALSGDTAVIGAPGDDPGGSAYVFVRSGGIWSQQAKLTASDAAAGDAFSCSVALSGDTVVIGASNDHVAETETGSAYVLDLNCLGACCLIDDVCVPEVSFSECDAQSGSFLAGVSCEPNPCLYGKGDVNCDRAVNTEDIAYFVAALIGGYTGCDITLADMDDSGAADGLDIQPFVDALIGS